MENFVQTAFDWLGSLEWQRLLPELIGKALGFLVGFAASWFLLFRRRLNAIQRMQSGDSDDFIFQVHQLVPESNLHDAIVPASVSINEGDDDTKGNEPKGNEHRKILLFRNVAPKTTLNDLYDNIAIREVIKKTADACTLAEPILQTEGTLGFELVNDALGHIAGLLAISSATREHWLFAMTCEDRQVVRKKCIRVFLIRPDDLKRFADWRWCKQSVLVEKPWHWFRVVALHRIALSWQTELQLQEQENELGQSNPMPLVDKQTRHDRIRTVSLGIYSDDQPIGTPHVIDWPSRLADLRKLGLDLNG